MVRTVPTVSNVDQSLEDIVQDQLKAKRGARNSSAPRQGGGRSQVQAPRRRRGSTGKTRSLGDSFEVAENGAQRTNLFAGARRGQSPPRDSRRDNERTKMMVSNLDYAVTQKDMEELFGEFPDFSKASLHFDQNGRSLGTCELVFRSRSGAMKAVKQYNGVPLDGKAMKIECVGEVQAAPVAARLGRPNRSPERRVRERSPVRRARGGRGGRGSGKGGNGGKREEKKEMTAEQLDKELDSYLAGGAN